MDVAWKLPQRWTWPDLADRTALYPALCLQWAGHTVALGRRLAAGRWSRAGLRVLVSAGPLAEDEHELLALTAARGQGAVVASQGGLEAPDREVLAELGFPIIAWTDPGPLASAPMSRPGDVVLTVSGCAARLAEDIALAAALGAPPPPAPIAPPGGPYLVVAADAAGLAEAKPALDRWVAESGGEVLTVGGEVDAADPGLLRLIGGAEALVCALGAAAVDSPRPGQWVRTALFQGAPVVAASHPSIDALAPLVLMDDFERALALWRRAPGMRLKAAAEGQAALAGRLEPGRIAGEWAALAQACARPAPRPRRTQPPLLLVLLDVFGDLDLMAPVLEAVRARGELRLRVLVSDWLAEGSPRTASELAGRGFAFEVVPREAVRAGETPSLTGVGGVLTGADATVRAHKAGHTLASRAKARGLATFTLQHGLENIGLTYKDHLHGEDVRFAAQTIFTWAGPEALAPWAAAETRAAALAVGSPKPAARAQAVPLGQGRWPRTVGVFENLHWHRFSEGYRSRLLADLEAAAQAHEDVLFWVKPHPAGRWLTSNPGRLLERANLVVVDPTDSAWEPHTAPALIAGMDAVLTTPSTVALDAARTGRPVGVLAYDLALPLYEPLPMIRGLEDLEAFLAGEEADALARNEGFLRRTALPGRADHRIAARIAQALREGAVAARPARGSRSG